MSSDGSLRGVPLAGSEAQPNLSAPQRQRGREQAGEATEPLRKAGWRIDEEEPAGGADREPAIRVLRRDGLALHVTLNLAHEPRPGQVTIRPQDNALAAMRCAPLVVPLDPHTDPARAVELAAGRAGLLDPIHADLDADEDGVLDPLIATLQYRTLLGPAYAYLGVARR